MDETFAVGLTARDDPRRLNCPHPTNFADLSQSSGRNAAAMQPFR